MKLRLHSLSRSCTLLLTTTLLLSGCKKDKGGGGGGDGDGDEAMGGARSDSVTYCDSDRDCDDSFYCNGEEICEDGVCRQGDRVDCDDGVECTVDRCHEETQDCSHTPPDNDGDGHADGSCEDENGTSLGDDCDDEDPLAYPGNQEICDADNRDEDCDPATFGTQDADRDGFIDALCCNEQSDGDLLCGDDCDDKRTNVNPAATEACDFLDNNCDGETDEGVSIEMFEDKDHDGRGDDEAGTVQTCAGAVGFAVVGGDCDDEDPEVFEGQFEICDGKDNNCDGQADEVQEQAPWYKDADDDGYGDPGSTPLLSCYRIPGRVLSQNDCDDDDNQVNPNATEICDAKDNDCNGLADFKLPGINNFEDDDADGAADSECGGSDCNDLDPRTSGGAEEVCDRIDNDCDGEVDEQTVQNIWYIDEDGDGWGVVIGSALASCDPIPNRASKFGDCNDGDRNIRPGIAELCDGVDQDCDGLVDEGAGVHCHLPNALNTCVFGQCAIFSCVPGYADTNNNPSDGCEAPVNPNDYLTGIPCSYDTDCNDFNICNGVETCSAGECRLGTPINCAAGPSIIQGNVTISTGIDIKDLEGIDRITGDLTIDSTLLNSLVGLEELRVIGGNLFIRNNGNLIRLSGSALSNLEVVGGGIFIENNPNLINVDLPSLVSVSSLNIVNNDKLVNIGTTMNRAYENLVNVEQMLYIADNDQLERINGFEAIGRIGGAYEAIESPYCDNQGGLEIEYNPKLLSVEAFDALAEVEGDVCIQNDYELTSVTFPALEEIGQVLYMRTNDVLQDIVVPELVTVGVSIEIDAYASGESKGILRSISMPSLESVEGGLFIENAEPHENPATLEVLDFPNLENVGGLNLNLQEADVLHTVDFSALETAESISIDYNTSVTPGMPVWTFPALTAVSDYIFWYFDGGITDVGAPLVNHIGDLYIEVTGEEIDTISFPQLQSIDWGLYITHNTELGLPLTDIDFGNLGTVGYEIDVTAATVGFDISSLTNIGTSNTGPLRACVAPADVCPEVERLFNTEGHTGTVDTCGACPQQVEAEL